MQDYIIIVIIHIAFNVSKETILCILLVYFLINRAAFNLKAGLERCSFQTKNQMVFVKKTHCKMWLCFDMVGHRRVKKGYQYQVSNAYS